VSSIQHSFRKSFPACRSLKKAAIAQALNFPAQRAACRSCGTSDPRGVPSGQSNWCDATVIGKLSFDITLNKL
jgi:hypothetical protein